MGSTAGAVPLVDQPPDVQSGRDRPDVARGRRWRHAGRAEGARRRPGVADVGRPVARGAGDAPRPVAAQLVAVQGGRRRRQVGTTTTTTTTKRATAAARATPPVFVNAVDRRLEAPRAVAQPPGRGGGSRGVSPLAKAALGDAGGGGGPDGGPGVDEDDDSFQSDHGPDDRLGYPSEAYLVAQFPGKTIAAGTIEPVTSVRCGRRSTLVSLASCSTRATPRASSRSPRRRSTCCPSSTGSGRCPAPRAARWSRRCSRTRRPRTSSPTSCARSRSA